MRKITPMILVMLMLVSALSSFDFAELEDNEVIEDTGARAGADADLVAITTPKETVCPLGAECRNVLKVGDDTTFSAYIKNSGDADISIMSSVNIIAGANDLRDVVRTSTMRRRRLAEHFNDALSWASRGQTGVVAERGRIAPDAVPFVVVDLEPVHNPVTVGVPIHRIRALCHVIVIEIDHVPAQFVFTNAPNGAGLGRPSVEDIPCVRPVSSGQHLVVRLVDDEEVLVLVVEDPHKASVGRAKLIHFQVVSDVLIP